MNIPSVLQHAISRQAQLLKKFIEFLESETDALSQAPDPQTLSQLGLRKKEFASRLAELDEQRTEALLAAGSDDIDATLNLFCEHDPALQQAVTHWRQLVRQARRINVRNGEILLALNQHNQKALQILQAQHGTSLYNAQGRLAPAGQSPDTPG
ncbi:flagella synthesis protein FlgN [Castellaniella sp.]|uniref:flagella synthesis protein FlgN n=1 Tax=Castellaniella sp. TaxID=1955812 RepID=UPI0035699FA2